MTFQERLLRVRGWSLVTKGVLLALVVAGLYTVVAPAAWRMAASRGMVAAGLAAAACLGGALIALVAGHVFRSPPYALAGVLLGMAARMGVPLMLVLVCWRRDALLVQAGLLYYLLIFYMVTLGVETLLSLPVSNPQPAQGMDA